MSCSITRLYMVGSCANTRRNDFSYLPDCRNDGGSVLDGSTATCNTVFASSTPLRAPSIIADLVMHAILGQAVHLLLQEHLSCPLQRRPRDTFRSLADIGLGKVFDEGRYLQQRPSGAYICFLACCKY